MYNYIMITVKYVDRKFLFHPNLWKWWIIQFWMFYLCQIYENDEIYSSDSFIYAKFMKMISPEGFIYAK
jgi:hypothetical protein